MAALPDGRFVIIGGTKLYNPFEGLSITTVFDPLTERFAQLEDMAHGRWYGRSLILRDGSLMAYSGQDENHYVNQSVELYNAGAGWSENFSQCSSRRSIRVCISCLMGMSSSPARCRNRASSIRPQRLSTTTSADTILKHKRKGGASVLLPLRPENSNGAKVTISSAA